MKKTFKIITIFVFLVIYISTSVVEAEKFNSSDGNIYAEFSLDKASYSPGEKITAFGAFTVNGFLDRDLMNICSTVVINGKDAASCMSHGTNIFAVSIPTGSFTAPLTAGIYTADLNIVFDYNSNHYSYSFPVYYGVVEPVVPLITVTVSADKMAVAVNDYTTIRYTIVGSATKCSYYDGNRVYPLPVVSPGEFQTGSLIKTTTYVVTCES